MVGAKRRTAAVAAGLLALLAVLAMGCDGGGARAEDARDAPDGAVDAAWPEDLLTPDGGGRPDAADVAGPSDGAIDVPASTDAAPLDAGAATDLAGAADAAEGRSDVADVATLPDVAAAETTGDSDAVGTGGNADTWPLEETAEAPRDAARTEAGRTDVPAGGHAPTCTCPVATIESAPLDTVTLSSACADPDGQPLTYQWVVAQRPPGSTAPLQTPTAPSTLFFVDVAGAASEPFVFRVTATDPDGESGHCDITLYAIPRDALHLQLVWDRDVTDLDLHLLDDVGSADPAGANGWFSAAHDCHYLNRFPDWGVPGDTRDNPRVDIDDVDGYGPENINIAAPVAGTYTIGVHYFCDEGLGASTATVRVYCQGAMAAEYSAILDATGGFWTVATVAGSDCTLTEVNAFATVSEGCPPARGL